VRFEMKTATKTGIRAGGTYLNHNETLVRRARVKTGLGAGTSVLNHNESLIKK
jgi:hypothetical protein